MSNEKLYTYNIVIRFSSEDGSSEEEVFNRDIQADTTEEVAQIVKADWDRLFEVLRSRADERFLKYEDISIDTWEIIRNSDGVSYWDDDTIPQGVDVSYDLIDILDP